MYLESHFRKKKGKSLFPPSLHSACWPIPSPRPARHPPLILGRSPAHHPFPPRPHSSFLHGLTHHRPVTTSTLLYSSVSLTRRARLSASSPTSVVRTRTHGDATATPRPRSSHRGSVHPRTRPLFGKPEPRFHPCCYSSCESTQQCNRGTPTRRDPPQAAAAILSLTVAIQTPIFFPV
jgi:hypothetical protein